MSANPALLLAAARDNNVELINALVADSGIPADWCNKIGQTALHIAALHGNVEAAKALLDLGCDVNIANDMQQTPIHFAANSHKNTPLICQLLLDAGADTGIADFRGTLPYENAQQPEIRMLLDGPDPRIFTAAESGDVALLKALFEEDPDADPAPFNEVGYAPTHLAATNGHLEALEYLLEKEAFINQQDLVQGDGIIHHAVRAGHSNIVTMLVAKGANLELPNFKANQYSHGNWMSQGATLVPLHHTPLALAVDLGEYDMAKQLLLLGAAVDPQDFDGCTPLQNALEMQEDELVELLLEHGADVNLATKDSASPLHTVCSQGNTGLAQTLITKGADVNACDEQGWTPLMLAVRGGKKGIVDVLLKAGADVGAVNGQGNSAVHLAAANNRTEILKVLLESERGRSAVTMANKEGKMPVDLAKEELKGLLL